jgi:membrane protein
MSSGAAATESRLRRGWRIVRDFALCMDRTRTLGLAAETAFWVFLSLLPLAAVMGVLAARLSLENWNAVVPLISSLPPAAQGLVLEQLEHLATERGGSWGLWGTLVFVWLASSGVHAMFDAIEIETGASRPWWRKRLYALGGCVALAAAGLVLALLGPGLELGVSWLARWWPSLAQTGEPTTAGRILRFALGVAVVFAFVCGLYMAGVPTRRRRKLPVVPGAALAVALEVVLGLGYTLYIAGTGVGNAYLGSLAVVGVTLTALYLFSLALLVGAALNRHLAHLPCPAPAPESEAEPHDLTGGCRS